MFSHGYKLAKPITAQMFRNTMASLGAGGGAYRLQKRAGLFV